MEPIVEVQNIQEMAIATKLGATVIGINNRDLTSFKVDTSTATRLMDEVKDKKITVAALSGISGPNDVEAYKKSGVAAVLVGIVMALRNIALISNDVIR